GGAFGVHGMVQEARDRAGHLGIDLVGLNLHQWLIALDAIARLLEPAADGALGDRLAELGHFDDGGSHQYSAKRRTAATTSSALGRMASSSALAYGTCVSAAASRMIGPSSSSKDSSAISADTSAPMPPVLLSSCRISTLLV